MQTAHTIITLFLAVVFLIAGLSKASGSAAGLSGTRDIGFPDGAARLVGIFETLAALSLVIGFALDNKDLKTLPESISELPDLMFVNVMDCPNLTIPEKLASKLDHDQSGFYYVDASA